METYLQYILLINTSICIWNVVLLTFNWQHIKPRRWLALMLLFWGISWGLRAYGLTFEDATLKYNIVLAPEMLLIGMFTSFTFLVWPIALMNPDKFNVRILFMFLIPFIICAIVYYGIIELFGLQTFTFRTLGDFTDHIAYFSVWFRIVMCLCLLGYLVVTVRLSYRYMSEYNKYVEENYAEYTKYTIKWIYAYLIGIVVISITYFTNQFYPSVGTFMVHNIVASIFLAWLSANVMVYNYPYKEDIREYVIPTLSAVKGEDFNSMFEVYKEQIEKWLLSERPYLSADFRLKDVISHFNLNRTYASKIFNEGFGKSFMLVIRELRVEYAKKLIEHNPSITMAEVSHLCGYSTPQAFHKAFVYCNDGQTPGEYALAVKTKEG